jgi:hypothetical protein
MRLHKALVLSAAMAVCLATLPAASAESTEAVSLEAENFIDPAPKAPFRLPRGMRKKNKEVQVRDCGCDWISQLSCCTCMDVCGQTFRHNVKHSLTLL